MAIRILDISFAFANELAREIFESEAFSRKYALEQQGLDNSPRVNYKVTRVLNRQFGVVPLEVGTITFARVDDERTSISLSPLPLDQKKMEAEVESMRRSDFRKSITIETSPRESVMKINATPEEVEADQQMEEAIAEKYRAEYKARAGELEWILQYYQESAKGIISASSSSRQDGLPVPTGGRGRAGSPGLSHDDLVYRLAMAQEAEEIRHSDDSKRWKEIAREIKWPHSVKLLEDARKRLDRLKDNDPDNLLAEVRQFRKEKKEIQ